MVGPPFLRHAHQSAEIPRLASKLMTKRAEQLFQQLNSATAILALIGQSEDLHLDCKEWPSKDDDAQRVFAKAACGLTNAEGGVLVIGLRAKPKGKDEPDLIVSEVPVADTAAVRSRTLDLISQLVEPGIEGVQVREIAETSGSRNGFVILYIPASEGLPRRSRKDWKFYLRIGSGTIPMEYFQVADMFGRRPKPKLDLYLEPTGKIGGIPNDSVPHRFFWLGLSNTGRALVKFPGIRFKRDISSLFVYQYGLDGNGNVGFPRRASDGEWIIFRGGVDDVIYPGETLKITQLVQRYTSGDPRKSIGIFDSVTFLAEISCEGLASVQVEKVLPPGRSS